MYYWSDKDKDISFQDLRNYRQYALQKQQLEQKERLKPKLPILK